MGMSEVVPLPTLPIVPSWSDAKEEEKSLQTFGPDTRKGSAADRRRISPVRRGDGRLDALAASDSGSRTHCRSRYHPG